VRDLQALMNVTPLAVVPTIRNSVYRRQHRSFLRWSAVATAAGAVLLFVGIRVWVN
jgi:hypothetical protein